MSAELIASVENCRIISRVGTGLDAIDIAAAAYLETDRRCGRAAKHFRRIMGHKPLWMLVADAAEPQAALREEGEVAKGESQTCEVAVAKPDQHEATRLLQAAAAWCIMPRESYRNFQLCLGHTPAR